jgi:tRNA(Ile)-lysidine synthase
MEVELPEGKYVLAVSGGVDSMALLDMLRKKDNIKLVIAHFDHGIRRDSFKDRRLVEAIAKEYGLPFETKEGKLSSSTSEASAREARYRFLRSVNKKYKADGIITAHHQDDLIETAFINILRGTGYRGLSAIIVNKSVRRPLLSVPKKRIREYAKEHHLTWNEDSTNDNSEYLRNYIRKQVMPQLSMAERALIVKNAEKVAKNNMELNNIIATISQKIAPNNIIQRSTFTRLPLEIENELAMHWLKNQGLRQYDRKNVERVVLAIKVSLPGTKHSVGKGIWLSVKNKTAEFSTTS